MAIFILGIGNIADSQVIRSCETHSPLSSQGGVALAGPTASMAPGTNYLELIPSICVAERYDSNVFYVSPTPGLQRDDFVTNVSPKLQINHNGDYASGFLIVGGFSETYINNPGLNFFGASGNLSLSLDNSIKKLLPNASVRISDIVTYTPLPPGFANPVAGTSPGDPGNPQNTFTRGLLTFRTNNLINVGTVSTSYATTASTTIDASYSHAILRFGSSPLTAQLGAFGGLFDVTTQTGTVGGSAQLTGLDKLTVMYSHTQSEFISSTASNIANSFQTDLATIGWSRTLTPNLRGELGGGGIQIHPGITTYAANAALVAIFPTTSATLSYSRTAFPSIQVVATTLTGDAFTLSAIQKIDQQWYVAESASYIRSSGDSGTSKLSADTYFASIDLYYWVTPIWSTALSYDYLNFDSKFGTERLQFDRHAITLSVRAMWD